MVGRISVVFCLLMCVLALDLTVDTPSGSLWGEVSPKEPGVHRYLGIPFSNPPLRFAKPEKLTPWKGVRDATYYRPACYQNLFILGISENCLYLDVYVPVGSSSGEKAVMVWIYGGGFVFGASKLYEGSRLAKTGDVIVVAINYRLGVFGWMYNFGITPGNLGLWDQKLALEWIHDNIQAFGGDKNRVTVFGESAGAISIAAMIMSPQINRTHFQRAIMQSGSTLIGAPPVPSPPGDEYGVLIKGTMCSKYDSIEKQVKCLRDVPACEIALLTATLTYLPAADGEFITNRSLEVLSHFGTDGLTEEVLRMLGNIRDYDIISGFNGQEGYFLLSAFQKLLFLSLDNGISDATYSLLTNIVVYTTADNILRTLELSNYVREKYAKEIPLRSHKDSNLENAVTMMGDYMMAVPAINTALLHSGAAPSRNTFMYKFGHVPVSGSIIIAGPSWLQTSASHADDVKFVMSYNLPWFIPYAKAKLSPEEENLSEAMMTYWSNFARFGNPKSQDFPDRGNHEWKEFSASDQNYIRFALHEDVPEMNPRADKLPVWKCVYEASFEQDGTKCVASSINNFPANTTVIEEASQRWLREGLTSVIGDVSPLNQTCLRESTEKPSSVDKVTSQSWLVFVTLGVIYTMLG